MHQTIEQHNDEIQANLKYWNKKPLLQKIYYDFYKKISENIKNDPNGLTIEIGSGIGNIKDVISYCLRTDIFNNPWIDQVENAYSLSFKDSSVSNIILFDVFHHLQFPGDALNEFSRVLNKGGRLIIFDPYIGILGLFIYSLFHHEPIAYFQDINWHNSDSTRNENYYAAQGNLTRIFFNKNSSFQINDWRIIKRQIFSSFSYITSGGYSKPQLYPTSCYSAMKTLDRICDKLPLLFGTRAMVILEKL